LALIFPLSVDEGTKEGFKCTVDVYNTQDYHSNNSD
jgi:hypothetical protein